MITENNEQNFIPVNNTTNSMIQTPSQGTPAKSPKTYSFMFSNGAEGIYAFNYFNDPLGFRKDVDDFSLYSTRLTGFEYLDEQLGGLFPGLYTVGAISSLGKTTFAHQLSDNLAASGEHVIFFSMEQSAFELFSKSISRELFTLRSAKADSTIPVFTATDIRKGIGKGNPYLDAAIDAYVSHVGCNLTIVPAMFSMTIEDIIDTIENYINCTKIKPIVVIDYLQIIKASSDGFRQLDTKDAIDHIVHSLKVYQSSKDIVVILISSLNRQNYMNTVDFESFKESGSIEYTSDVIWGMQLGVLQSSKFESAKTNEKRDMVRDAKIAFPREIDLICLKNRFGVASYRSCFNYYSAYDYFINTENEDIS